MRPHSPSIVRPAALALIFPCALAGYGLLGPVRANPVLLRTFLISAGLLLGWAVILLGTARAKGRRLLVQVSIQKQHYLQACVHSSILIYWGWYWQEGVYAYAYLILAQLLFAYAFDILLCWSRREIYTLGFGPFPIVFSINLFLWFKADWFYFQLATVALGLLAKELLRWQKDGRSAHIFNPSSFPLAVVSVALLVTGSSGITWGEQIAVSQFFPPHMYLFLFLVALPGQYLFGVTTMTFSAVVSSYLFGLGYFAATGSYFFFDSYIPIAVFLGMHLLFTDPSTAPRTELGRLIFGVLYSASVIVLFALLDGAGLPSFYDKLLAVPLLNLSIKLIDRAARSKLLRRFDPARLAPSLTGRRRNLAYISIWAVTFALMSAAQGVGDDHPGHRLPFWQSACRDNRRGACQHLTLVETADCAARSGWACNELGVGKLEARQAGSDARDLISLGCVFGFQPACANARSLAAGEGPPAHAPPTLGDYRVLLAAGKGLRLSSTSPTELYARACAQGWPDTCGPR